MRELWRVFLFLSAQKEQRLGLWRAGLVPIQPKLNDNRPLMGVDKCGEVCCVSQRTKRLCPELVQFCPGGPFLSQRLKLATAEKPAGH